ncbi:MAG: copper oxidase (laccase) domain-containing protein [Candidatus Paceibacteria bacterium]|jgi:copper oxidase (laccase) domain-containing protein
MRTYVYSLEEEVNVAIYGPDTIPLRSLAIKDGAKTDKVCLVKAPGSETRPGYQTIIKPQFGLPNSADFDVYSEGVILTEPGSAAIIRTGDCPIIVLYELVQRRSVVTHAGRAAMKSTSEEGDTINNIVTIAYDLVVNNYPSPYVSAYITGSICGKCFEHNGPGDEKFVEPFDRFGQHAFTDRSKGAIDLVSVISHQLEQFDIPEWRIKHDGLCTKESDWLASYRRDKDEGRNTIVAVLH